MQQDGQTGQRPIVVHGSIELITESHITNIREMMKNHILLMEVNVTDSANSRGASRSRSFFGTSKAFGSNVRKDLKGLQDSIFATNFTYAISDVYVKLHFEEITTGAVGDEDLAQILNC